MGQSLNSIAQFLQIPQHDPELLANRHRKILEHIDSFGAFKIALEYIETLGDLRSELNHLITSTWDVVCVERINTAPPQHPNELRIIFHEAPEGGIARQHIIEILKGMEHL
jgi:hypothetical protein